jgi:hypothetical protein
VAEALGELMKRSAARVAGARVEAAFESAADGRQISVACGGEDAISLPVVDAALSRRQLGNPYSRATSS